MAKAKSAASNNTYGFDCQTSTSTGTKSYNKAFLVLSNTDYYDGYYIWCV